MLNGDDGTNHLLWGLDEMVEGIPGSPVFRTQETKILLAACCSQDGGWQRGGEGGAVEMRWYKVCFIIWHSAQKIRIWKCNKNQRSMEVENEEYVYELLDILCWYEV